MASGTVTPVAIGHKWQVHDLVYPGWIPVHQCVIDFVDSVCLELRIEVAVGIRSASQSQDTAGVMVQAVDDPQLSVGRFQDPQEVRGGRVSARDCEHTGRFVNHQQ